jgi:hypothetical protein
MTDKPREYGQEVRDTVIKSSLTGVAATVLAVAVFSPAGLGGMIGTSLASGFGLDTNSAAADDPYASLPPYPAPLSVQELSDIHNQLARTTASLEITRAATEAKIEHIRALALNGDLVTFAPMQQNAGVGDGLRLRTSEPEAFAVTASAPVEIAPAPVQAVMTPVAEATLQPISFAGGVDPTYRDPHLELADLLLAHETY